MDNTAYPAAFYAANEALCLFIKEQNDWISVSNLNTPNQFFVI